MEVVLTSLPRFCKVLLFQLYISYFVVGNRIRHVQDVPSDAISAIATVVSTSAMAVAGRARIRVRF